MTLSFEGHRGPGGGRRPSTTHEEIARVALELFERDGFDATTVEHIADAVGIARRTLFRYFPSKNDIVWGNFDGEIARLRQCLVTRPVEEPALRAIRRAVVATNDFGAQHLPELRRRITLLTQVPTLQAHSTIRYAVWRQEVARFAAHRTGGDPDGLIPQAVGHATLGVTLAAFLDWVRCQGGSLRPHLDTALQALEDGFAPEGS